jgi:hypothetical protein
MALVAPPDASCTHAARRYRILVGEFQNSTLFPMENSFREEWRAPRDKLRIFFVMA